MARRSVPSSFGSGMGSGSGTRSMSRMLPSSDVICTREELMIEIPVVH
jgi:hypothetical protein